MGSNPIRSDMGCRRRVRWVAQLLTQRASRAGAHCMQSLKADATHLWDHYVLVAQLLLERGADVDVLDE
jgi:hypothetical protein